MELSQILQRALYVLRAIEGRSGLDQLDGVAVNVLLRIAEAEFSGDTPRLSMVVQDNGEGREEALSRIAALERAGWLSSSGSAGSLGPVLHLTRRARDAFVVTAARLPRHRS